MTQIALEELDPAGHTSFSFYELMPGQGHQVVGAPAAVTALDDAEHLLRGDLLDTPALELDRFTALVLTHGAELPQDERLARLAEATARAFALLLGNEAQRPRRMRLARLSLMLRVILDRDADSSGVLGTATLPAKSPWDLVTDGKSAGSGWTASCDHDNLRRLEAGRVRWSRRAGLPTQLDPLAEGLWIGSHYSNGGYIVRSLDQAEPELLPVQHTAPLVLAFDLGNERWALDFAGTLWQLQGTTLARKLLQLPGQVHRARVIDGSLYAFDWAKAGTAMRVDLVRLRAQTIATGDILICNDVCGHDGVLYGICKLQGRVFKMAADWTPLGTRLGAGTAPVQLLDPIMIRSDGDQLSVLNWFSAKLVQLKTF